MASTVAQFAALVAAVAINNTAPPLGLPQALQQSWAQYSPWFPAATYVPPPGGAISFKPFYDTSVAGSKLQRHGARYPEKAAGKAIKKSVKKLKRAKSFRDASLKFVEDYKYALGVDDLVPFGAAQSFDAGQQHFARYAGLVNADMLPFVRASDSDRVIDSARNWTAGFAYASNQEYIPELSVIISQSTNDTLDDKMCPEAGSSAHATKKWVDAFAPAIADRINAEAPGAKLKKTDIPNLMSLCPFDTVAYEEPSPWCNLFTREEWADYEYYGDLFDYYGNGYGQKLGRVQGVGYVNELLARLTSQPVHDETQTNHTLDFSPLTFPLDKTFYADFSHDNQMISIYSALGLFVQPRDLHTKHVDTERTWFDSKMVPFSGRLITEKMECTVDGRRGDYVRILVNDALQPLEFCGATGNGLCTLANFVESQHYARNDGEGDWPLCFE
ncbi:histidine phosphatase superfamily [Melanogaster broomeanus]|nr:histidine phosphatase superfamily [Melanogaster broomeanus]